LPEFVTIASIIIGTMVGAVSFVVVLASTPEQPPLGGDTSAPVPWRRSGLCSWIRAGLWRMSRPTWSSGRPWASSLFACWRHNPAPASAPSHPGPSSGLPSALRWPFRPVSERSRLESYCYDRGTL